MHVQPILALARRCRSKLGSVRAIEDSMMTTGSPRLGVMMLLTCTIVYTSMIGQGGAAINCETMAKTEAPIYSPRLAQVVIGTGRLQFYSAPSGSCPLPGVFIIPRDQVVAYSATDDGWTSVMYIRADGSDVQGWVRSGRLKTVGTMGPSQ